MIWIVGEYAERIDNADELLASFLDNFAEEAPQVQLQLLTGIVKLFLKRPSNTQQLVQKVLGLATQVGRQRTSLHSTPSPLSCCCCLCCGGAGIRCCCSDKHALLGEPKPRGGEWVGPQKPHPFPYCVVRCGRQRFLVFTGQ
jgi:vesicle coat complex subunit